MSTDPTLIVDTVFDLDSLLTDEERDWQLKARAFATERILPVIEDDFENKYFRRELVAELGAAGFLGMHLQGYGCAGAGAVAYGLVCLELEAADSGWRTFVSVQGSLAMSAIHKHGREEQKQHWLPRMAAGEAIGCFGLTEPSGGSDPAAMTTTARRDGERLGARRRQALDRPGEHRRRRRDLGEGDRHRRLDGRARLRRADRHRRLHGDAHRRQALDARLDPVRRDARGRAAARPMPMLPGARGLSGPFACLNEARYGIVWGAMGAARSCLEAALGRARSREVFGEPDRRQAARAGQAGRHVRRIREGRAARPAPGPAQGARRAHAGADQRRQAQQRARGAAHRARGPVDPRRATASPAPSR